MQTYLSNYARLCGIQPGRLEYYFVQRLMSQPDSLAKVKQGDLVSLLGENNVVARKLLEDLSPGSANLMILHFHWYAQEALYLPPIKQPTLKDHASKLMKRAKDSVCEFFLGRVRVKCKRRIGFLVRGKIYCGNNEFRSLKAFCLWATKSEELDPSTKSKLKFYCGAVKQSYSRLSDYVCRDSNRALLRSIESRMKQLESIHKQNQSQ